jgi:hypothetical protein
MAHRTLLDQYELCSVALNSLRQEQSDQMDHWGYWEVGGLVQIKAIVNRLENYQKFLWSRCSTENVPQNTSLPSQIVRSIAVVAGQCILS